MKNKLPASIILDMVKRARIENWTWQKTIVELKKSEALYKF